MIFKKKPIYIAGVILFSLLLIADVAIYFLAAPGDQGDMPGRGGSSFNGEMPEGFDSENFDPGSFGGQLPGGGGFGGFEGEMPEDFDGSNMPEGFGSGNFGGQRPEAFDGSLPNREEVSVPAGNGFLSAIRSAFWPILIVCVLGDALCIFMLIRISGKKGNKQDPSGEDDDSDNPPRRDRTNTVLAIIAVLLVGAVILSSLPVGEADSGMEAQISIQQAQAAENDLASVFSGSGTLASSDADEIAVPSTVKVTAYTVKNGDAVQVGDVIAYVDKTSVQKAIYDMQALIAEMDAEIAQVQSDTLDGEITARADGRVKAIYVAVGDSVAGAMYENGAVILISLGGSMTVVIESDRDVTVGETLTVTLSDGTQIEGKVQQVRSGKITVTTTDDGPEPDDTVSVAAEDGTVLGTGTLSISSPMKVTGYFGTVSKIRVSVGDKVQTGDVLITLNDTEDLARYQKLLRERSELTEMVAELSVIYRDGAIKARSAGVVSQIDEDALLSQPSNAAGSSASSSAGYKTVQLASVGAVGTGETAPSGSGTVPPAETHADGTFAGKVTKVTYGALQIKISETDMTGSTIADVETMNETLFTAEKRYAPSLSVPVNMYQNGQTLPSSVDAIQAGDKVLIRIEGGTVSQIDFIMGTGMSGPSQGTTPGGNMQFPSSGGNFGGYQQPVTSEEDEEEAVYEVEKTSVCAIIPAEIMTVDISVDELDILTLAVGQEAAITLDALPGQSFAGTVKKINPTGTNEGGSTKYTVTMEVLRTEQMLDGMNASVLIEVSRLDRVLTVPAAAVQEDGNRTYVYTALDEKTGQPAKPVNVTTGSSDGTNIEILSGLASGDTVYYSYADSIVYRFAS